MVATFEIYDKDTGELKDRESLNSFDQGQFDAELERQNDSFTFYTLADLANIPETEWLIPGILPDGGLCLLSGPSGSGKSLWVASLLKAGATGGRFLGREIPPLHSWYFSEASPRDTKSQFARVGMGGDADIRIAFHGTEKPRSSYLLADLIWRQFDAHKGFGALPRLIVIDTMGKWLSGCSDWNDYTESTRELDPLVRLGAHLEAGGCTLLVLHHASKSGAKGSVESSLGSTAIAGSFGTKLQFWQKPDSERRAIAVSTRAGDSGYFEMELDDSGEYQHVNDRAELEAAIFDAIGLGATNIPAISQTLECEGITHKQVRSRVEAMEKRGALSSSGKGKGKVLFLPAP